MRVALRPRRPARARWPASASTMPAAPDVGGLPRAARPRRGPTRSTRAASTPARAARRWSRTTSRYRARAAEPRRPASSSARWPWTLPRRAGRALPRASCPRRTSGRRWPGARVVVCPSPYESLSIVLLEAFALGTPGLVNARSRRAQGPLPALARRPLLRRRRRVRGGPGPAGTRRRAAPRAGRERPALRRGRATAGTSCSTASAR